MIEILQTTLPRSAHIHSLRPGINRAAVVVELNLALPELRGKVEENQGLVTIGMIGRGCGKLITG